MIAAVGAAAAAEWIKIRTMRSAAWNVLLTLLVSVGLGYLLGRLTSADPGTVGDHDPIAMTFYGLTLGQLALVAFAALVVGTEYSSGTIRGSLTAMPRRGVFYGGKLIAATLVLAVVSAVTVTATFVAAQVALGPYSVPITHDGVPEAFVGACLHLTLLGLFALGVATMLRGSARTLGILLPLFFLGSQGLGNVPKVRAVTQFLPDQVGMVIMHLAGPQDQARWARAYGPWTGIAILALWAAAALLGGYVMLRRRDA
jgi:ABC-type transport system involved in multi-copper enzyme maturation permease subunit